MMYWIKTKSLGVSDRILPPERWRKAPDLVNVISMDEVQDLHHELLRTRSELEVAKQTIKILTDPPILTTDQKNFTIKG